ncbi:hypothetical protein Tco_1128675, partial [Tanacetum coccineum]
SKETPNEPSSLGTTSGGGPGCQETMGGTIAQTRVFSLEKTQTSQTLMINTQQKEITSLKRKFKKLIENRSRTHRLKRLYMVGSTRMVDSSDKESLGKVASKQGRIDDIDANAGITLVSTYFDGNTDMFGVNDLVGDKVIVENVPVNADGETVSAAATTIAKDEVTLAQALLEIKKITTASVPVSAASTIQKVSTAQITTAAPTIEDILVKIDADAQLAAQLQAQEQEELSIEEKSKLFVQFLEQRKKHFVAKRAEENRNRPPTKAQ